MAPKKRSRRGGGGAATHDHPTLGFKEGNCDSLRTSFSKTPAIWAFHFRAQKVGEGWRFFLSRVFSLSVTPPFNTTPLFDLSSVTLRSSSGWGGGGWDGSSRTPTPIEGKSVAGGRGQPVTETEETAVGRGRGITLVAPTADPLILLVALQSVSPVRPNLPEKIGSHTPRLFSRWAEGEGECWC